jgi:hypothetical protein
LWNGLAVCVRMVCRKAACLKAADRRGLSPRSRTEFIVLVAQEAEWRVRDVGKNLLGKGREKDVT